MPSLLEIFSTSFEQYSIVWIVISGAIGAVIAACTKFIFEHSLPQWQLKRSTRIAIQKYSFPLLRSSFDLEQSIRVLLIEVSRGKLDSSKNDYFHLRILYFFGRFFGWCKILSNETVLEYVRGGEIKSQSIGNFAKHYNIIFKGISNLSYFHTADDIPKEAIESARIPALVISCIGDLMVRESTNSEDTSSNVISFLEFTRSLEQNPEYRKWFAYIENLITDLKSSHKDAKWNRLIIFYTNLKVFIDFLRRNRDRPTVSHKILRLIRRYLHLGNNVDYLIAVNKAFINIHPKVRDNIRNDLRPLKYNVPL